MMNIFNKLSFNSTEEWHKIRSKGLGGSDIGTLLGLNSYKTPYTLFREKIGLKEADDLSDNKAVQRGNRAEKPLRDLINALYPEYEFEDPQVTFQRKDKPWMLANLDGLSKDGLVGLEIKTANVRRMDDWTNCIPQTYYAQIMWYLATTGLEKFIMFAYVEQMSFDGSEPRMNLKKFEILRSEEEIKYIEKKAEEFWVKVENRDFGEHSINIEI